MNEIRDELLYELITKKILNPKLQQEIQTAFKLQELVKERMRTLKISINDFNEDNYEDEANFQQGKLSELQSLVEESEK